MSHYTVMVIGPETDQELEEALAPFDENIEVEPYRDYNVWIPDDLKTKEPKEIAKELKERWGGDEDYRYDPDKDAVYIMSTYNPESKWDWWTLGGRWHGLLPLVNGAKGKLGRPSFMGPDNVGPNTADWAKVKDIDFEKIRQEQLNDRNTEYDVWEMAVEAAGGEPPVFNPDTDDIKEYRENDMVGTFWKVFLDNGIFMASVEDYAGKTREQFLAENVNPYALTYAVLMGDEWIEPGKMGWFGMCSDTEDSRREYNKTVSDIIHSLDPDTWVAVVDCHI